MHVIMSYGMLHKIAWARIECKHNRILIDAFYDTIE